MNRKGSLNLSIQAIVIVVIAFVVLGLGLGFVQGVFDDITGQSDKIFTDVQERIGSEIAKSNDPLYYPAQKVSLEAGEEIVDGVGVKNVGDLPLDLRVVFQVSVDGEFQEFESGEIQTFGQGADEFVAGVFWDDTIQKYSQGESGVITFTLTAPDKFGNYLYKIQVVKEDGEIYASKTFFVRTS